jgi:NDP-sugar pyrophosphorylase family protein
MKAVILAAGKGERLGNVTSQLPKPMIVFRGKPILQHNIELCHKFGVYDLYINTHHKPEVIREYFGDGSKFGVKIQYSFEENLLGTSGGVKNFQKYLGTTPFFVLYGDNYSQFDLDSLAAMAETSRAPAVIGFHWREDTESSGVAEFASDGRVTRFIEKPKPGESQSHWVNAGVYFLRPGIFLHIPDGVSDFAMDVFPKMFVSNASLYGVCSRDQVVAFDTPEMYNRSMDS